MAVAVAPTPFSPLGPSPEQGLLVQGVVRGVVNNMEFVLSDLQAIMGNIQSLVSHIDSVTGRTGRLSRSGRTTGRARSGASTHETPTRSSLAEEQDSGTARENRQHVETQQNKDGSVSTANNVHNKRASNNPRTQETKSTSCNGDQGISRSQCDDAVNGNTETVGQLRIKPDTSKRVSKCTKRWSHSEVDTRPSHDFYAHGSISLDCSGFDLSRKPYLSTEESCPVLYEYKKNSETSDPLLQKKTDATTRSNDSEISVKDTFQQRELTNSHDVPMVKWDKPRYQGHVRDDSRASRGEYDLSTQEATLGCSSDCSDDSHSRHSLTDSPLRLKHESRRGKISQFSNGSVAVVHPILKPETKRPIPDKSLKDVEGDITDYGRYRVCSATFGDRKPFESENQPNMKLNDGYEIPVTDPSKQKCTHVFTRIYNKYFQASTPTEQNTFEPQIKHLHEQVELSKLNNGRSLAAHLNQEGNYYSLPGSPKQNRRHSALRPQNMGFGTVDANRNQVVSCDKPLYSRVDGSPTSSRSLSTSVRCPTVHHYYHSIDSDMDSDGCAVAGFPDGRTMTPDLDWSYLNLMDSCDRFPLSVQNVGGMYEVPRSLYRSNCIADAPSNDFGNISKVPFYHILSSRAPSLSSKSNSSDVTGQALLASPISPMECDGTGNFDSDHYCGCYEAALDAVLENVAGFESFDEACEHLESDDILTDTYISFDEQFEEDDWDVGLKSEDAALFPVALPYLPETRGLACSNVKYNGNGESYRAVSRPCVLDLSYKTTSLMHTNINNNKETDNISSEISLLKRGTNNIVADNAAGIDNRSEACSQTQWLQGNRHVPRVVPCGTPSRVSGSTDSWSQEGRTEELSSSLQDDDMCGPIMTASFDTSLRAVASGSPMSLCSSDTAATSPGSERCFVTSSEGDDLFTSHDESYFLLSPTSPQAGFLDNAAIIQANSRGRLSTRDLSRQFLATLRDVCERQSGATFYDDSPNRVCGDQVDIEHSGGQNKLLPTGGFGSSSDSSTITASSSTATDATVTVDNSPDNTNCRFSLRASPDKVYADLSSSNGSNYLDEAVCASRYNRNVNTWTAYGMVHVQPDELVSEGAVSDIVLNDNDMLGV